MIKNVRETRRIQGAQAQGNITFPFLAIRQLTAMRCWAAEVLGAGRPLNPGHFIGALITTAVLQYSLDAMRTSTTEDEVVNKPKELTDLSKWETFWEQWKTYTERLHGAAKCPLTYIFRDHEQVTNAIHMANYPNHDTRLIKTTTLTGPWYELDNHRIYDEFKALVLKGPGWSFIKAFDHTKDGRGAVLTLRHVEVHQGAHNTLLDLNKPVPETKKVTDFLAGITDPCLSNAKDLILGDAQKLQDFESCQQYLMTLVYNKTTQEKHERQVSGVCQAKTAGGWGHKNEGGKDPQAPGITARTYSQEEWSKLTNDKRAKIKELRKAQKASNRGRGNGPDTRNTLAVQQDGGQSDQSHDDPASKGDDDEHSRDTSDGDDNHTLTCPPTRRSGKSVRRS
jgi:hypothetical protein